MPLHWFTPPVYVESTRVGERYAVSSVERAAEFLLSWREQSGAETWRFAIATCMAAIKGEVPAVHARKAFEAAARECGKLV
ncbi:DUF982 domain-containing protein [Bosea sp. RAF48]|uniref:DUF982 domain-containing protein n=1 Tax=Bosea sp. RAF48 TaxID=3237480 RepID=UPI003F916F58